MPVLCFSGGIDSTVLLWDLALHPERFAGPDEDLLALSFNFGTASDLANVEVRKKIARKVPKSSRRIEFVEHKCEVPRLEVPADDAKTIAAPNATDEIPLLFTPGRHPYIYLVALMHAAAKRMEAAYVSLTNTGVPDYDTETDNTVAYAYAFGEEMRPSFSMTTPVPRLISPYTEIDKSAVVRIGRRLGAPIELTDSCEFGVRYGVCAQCVAAKRSVMLADRKDSDG